MKMILISLILFCSISVYAQESFFISTTMYGFYKAGDTLWIKIDDAKVMDGTKAMAREIGTLKKNDPVFIIDSKNVFGNVHIKTKTISEGWIDEAYLRGRAISIPVNYNRHADYYTNLIKDSPSDYHYIYFILRGIAKAKFDKDTSSAYDDFNFSNSYRPNHIAFSFAGEYLMFQKDYDKALENFGKAFEACQQPFKRYKATIMDKDQASISYNMGLCHYALGKYNEAQQDFELTLIYNQMDENAYLYKGLSLIKAGNKSLGCENINTANKLGAKGASEAISKYCQ